MFDFIDNYKLVLVSDIKSFVQRIRQTSKSRHVMHICLKNDHIMKILEFPFAKLLLKFFLNFHFHSATSKT